MNTTTLIAIAHSRVFCSIGYLKSQMPSLMGKEKKQQKLINDLPNVFRTIMKKYNLAPGDFPVRGWTSNKQGLVSARSPHHHLVGHQQIL